MIGRVGDLRRWWVGLVVEALLGSDGGGEACYIFTGVGVDKHVERLWEYGLVRRSFDVVDIQQLAVRKHGWNIDKLSLDVLARDVIGREQKKPVKCASIDAFVAFDSDHRVLLNVLARDLNGRAWEKPVNEKIDKWDNQYLSKKQVKCASIDAFLSFELGRVLLDQ
ncbi:Werner syndrome-like exonuclease [Tanacetum coccineum]